MVEQLFETLQKIELIDEDDVQFLKEIVISRRLYSRRRTSEYRNEISF